MTKSKIEEFLVKTDQKIAGYDKDGKTIYGTPIKLFETGIQREEGWFYYVKDGEDEFLEIWRTPLDRKKKK